MAAADRVVDDLLAWQARRAERASGAERDTVPWAELFSALEGSALASLRDELGDLDTEHQRLLAAAQDAQARLDVALRRRDDATRDLGVEPAEAGDEDRIGVLLGRAGDAAEAARTASAAATATAENTDGAVRERARTLPSVAEAEEAQAAAQAERDGVSELDATLTRTVEFLQAAQDQVHRLAERDPSH